jgi:hypothetical protein
METRIGCDLNDVRVHTDAMSAQSADAVGALAYTVGRDIMFGVGQYAPGTDAGKRMLAHELIHVVQQSAGAVEGTPGPGGVRVSDPQDRFEREAEFLASGVVQEGPLTTMPWAGRRPVPRSRASGAEPPALQRHPKDAVAYSGGQSGVLDVISAGKVVSSFSAVSGHPGHGENEPSEGPIPTHAYWMHPNITQPTVAAIQSGICGAAGIGTGFQQITSTDPSPCSGAHYCNVPCPTAAEPVRKCFTPVDCWGPMRIKIEGSAAVVTPTGARAVRDGFYLHGGNPADAVTSGCIKTLDNAVFPEVRRLTGVNGAVPLCVGTACPAWVQAAQTEALVQSIAKVFAPVTGLFKSFF